MRSILLLFLIVFGPKTLTPEFIEVMKRTTWRAGCPVAPSELRLLTLPYWDYEERSREGELIVNPSVADEVDAIFRELYEKKFPIEKMRPIEEYGGSDDRSMEANNTSAFNCRDITDGQSTSIL